MSWDSVGRSVERDVELAAGLVAVGLVVIGGVVALGVDVLLRRHRQP